MRPLQVEEAQVRGAAQWYANPLRRLADAGIPSVKLREIMRPGVPTVGVDAPVLDAARAMEEAGAGCLLVTSREELVGIMTGADLAGCVGQGHRSWDCLVYRHMSFPVVFARPETDALDASHLMTEKGIKRLPVVERGIPVGVVSILDIHSILDRQVRTAEVGRGSPVEGA